MGRTDINLPIRYVKLRLNTSVEFENNEMVFIFSHNLKLYVYMIVKLKNNYISVRLLQAVTESVSVNGNC